MYILKGRKRNELRWLLIAGLLTVVIVVLLNHFHAILARNAFIVLNIYFISSLLIIFYVLRESDEKSLLAATGRFLSDSSTRFTLFCYLVYGSIAFYPLAEEHFQSEFIGRFGFVVIFLVMGFPDVLLFLRTRLDSGKTVYQKANVFGFCILMLLVVISVGAGMMASK